MDDIVLKVQDWFNRAETGRIEWENKARENVRFYASKQWDDKDIEVLKKQKRPVLTINKIFPIINFLAGYQRQNKYDIIIVPRKNTTKDEADLLTEIIKQILDVNNGELEISRMFFDGILTGRGFLTGYVDYTDDPINGDLKLERVNPFDIYLDPDFTKYDLSDADFIIKVVWVSFERLRAEFPDKAEEIDTAKIDLKNINFSTVEKSVYEENQGLSFASLKESKVKILECWYKTPKKTFFIFNPLNNKYYEVEDEEKVREVLSLNPNLKVFSRIKNVLNLATICGNVVLQDIEKPLGEFNDYPFIPFFPYKLDRSEEIKDTEIGVVDNLKDLQREINKRRSQQLHIINTSANSGWINKKGDGADPKILEKFGSTPGVVIEYANVPPVKINPSPLSQAHLITEEKAATDLKEVSGINPDLLGYRAERGEPGIVLQLRQQQGIVIIESLFDNFRLTHKLLGKALIDIITKSGLYSPQEMANIVDIRENPRYIQAIQTLFSDTGIKKYSVVVNLQPSSPTLRMINFYKLVEVSKIIPIPPDILIKASDLPYKEEILQRLEQIQNQQASPVPINKTGSLTATPEPLNLGELLTGGK